MLRRALLLLGIGLTHAAPSHAEPSALPRRGKLTVVTYNVAGLPEGLSGSRPVANLPAIGAALERYDLALIQEDYAYPQLLRSRLRLPYRSAAFIRGNAAHFGDGLSLFAKLPFEEPRRAAWKACHGVFEAYFDCLTPKGLSMARLELSSGVTPVAIDAYNVHLDAGSSAGDIAARAQQLRQLFRTIASWSDQRAVLLGGDFNLTADEVPLLRELAKQAKLLESCAELRCGHGLRLDRVLYRSSTSVALAARSYRVETDLRDQRGRPLSDHLAVVVSFDWRAPGKVEG